MIEAVPELHEDGSEDEPVSNESQNRTFEQVLQEHLLSRRQVLKGGLGAFALGFAGVNFSTGCGPAVEEARRELEGDPFGFDSVPVSSDDTIHVPAGYVASVLFAWGDPVSDGPAFKQDASNTAAEQEQQAGMNHDGQHFFPLPYGSRNPDWGLLAMNHEYTDEGLLHPGGMLPVTAEKVLKSQAAHGVSVIEVRRRGLTWSVVRPSIFGRRITGRTPCRIAGPAAGAPAMRTQADPEGTEVLGTYQGCSYGATPWGTFLTCEENFNSNFINRATEVPADQRRYGVPRRPTHWRWWEHDERFDAERHPNEFNRFGWIVEIDPYDPTSTPVKRTALGRIKREGATIKVAADDRLVVYSGDDQRFEYIYKFVTDRPYDRHDRSANKDLLDHGTLYVARFDAAGTGEWLELTQGKNGLVEAAGFPTQADVVIRVRAAADVVGATKMDRPEWIAVRPGTSETYCTLTNNSRRGSTFPVDPANPRANNVYGHIIRWRETDDDPTSTSFDWVIFLLCVDPAIQTPDFDGDFFGSPDGLFFDDSGLLWICTDISTGLLNNPAGPYKSFGNNAMLLADPDTREVRRFLTGPRGCEITGMCMTPDRRYGFVQIQHPGEPGGELTAPGEELMLSTWPDGPLAGRPRAATVVIRRLDGRPLVR